jgi:hypothetical protein
VTTVICFSLYGIIYLILLNKEKQRQPQNISLNEISPNLSNRITSKIVKVGNMLECRYNSKTDMIYTLQGADELDNYLSVAILTHEYCHSVDYGENKNNYKDNKFFDKSALISAFLLPVLFMYTVARLFFWTFDSSIAESVVICTLIFLLFLQWLYHFFVVVLREFRVFFISIKLIKNSLYHKKISKIFSLNLSILLIERLALLSASAFVLSVLFVN